ncbi:MAG TPA: hypothetical protein PKL65_08370 [Bacteroidales bacterium]|nr:hypothetical protein [Bacteroidales bacterium]HNR42231.1 hypothetical protein [Bacteroidales bacterium]HPM19326.1 hypothetical protein [Bacteroidales bacterium]
MKRLTVILLCIMAVTAWQCTKDERNLSLKESIERSAARINTAADAISVSKGFSILTVTDYGAKSDDNYGFRDSIDLEMIAGIYDFKPGEAKHHHHFFPLRLFEKTGESDKMIINMPEKLAFHPMHLHFCDRADSVLKNNFTIRAAGYHYYFTGLNNSDYRLEADFSLNSEDIGKMSMYSAWKQGFTGEYSKKFTFPEGYSVISSGSTGDTVKLIFALAEGGDILLKEALILTGKDFRHHERQYILSVGNVDMKKTSGIDSIQVFLNGVLQKKAAAKITDAEADDNPSICRRRDILLTFDDGTTAKLSDLLSPARKTLKLLHRSIGEMYFSKYIVDYIALSIYYNNHQ